jgi:hypothetical protein
MKMEQDSGGRNGLTAEYVSKEIIMFLTLHVCIGKFNTMKDVREEAGDGWVTSRNLLTLGPGPYLLGQ